MQLLKQINKNNKLPEVINKRNAYDYYTFINNIPFNDQFNHAHIIVIKILYCGRIHLFRLPVNRPDIGNTGIPFLPYYYFFIMSNAKKKKLIKFANQLL